MLECCRHSEAHAQLMSELEDRVVQRLARGRSPPRELTFVRRSVANAKLHAAVATQWLYTVYTRPTEGQGVEPVTFVTRDTCRERLNTNIDLSSSRLDVLRNTMLERVLDSSDRVGNAVGRRDYLDQKLVILTKLAHRMTFSSVRQEDCNSDR